MGTDEVLVSIDGAAGRLRLNRPKAIHALNLAMCRAMNRALEQWRDNDRVAVVLIDHAPAPDGDPKLSRGFCAGGDIRMIAQSGAADGKDAREFFREEYRLNHRLFTYDKPVAAFMDGITMGGGVGISAPATYRIATENTRFAMPETGIGLFPDVGGGWYLSRLPGETGAFLALTGARLDGAECVALGLATHYIASAKLEAVKAAIAAAPERIEAVLAEHNDTPPDARILANRGEIDRLFRGERVEDIIAALEADGGDWAQKELDTLRSKSPESMKVSLRLVREGARETDFADEMRKEYAIASRVSGRPDFIEGVRALIVDKDNAPKWSPTRLEDVSDATLDEIFAPMPDGEGWTAD